MKRLILNTFLSFIFPVILLSQPGNHTLLGYWHNWNTTSAPYIPLNQVDNRFGYISIAFAEPEAGSNSKIGFSPAQVSPAVLLSQIHDVQSQGRKVLLSLGGGTQVVTLSNTLQRDTFISSVETLIEAYDLDGIDIDFENSSLTVSGGTINNPTDPVQLNLIAALRQIMKDYRIAHGKRLLLTFAPETAYVQGGQSAYNGIWGGYLPVIQALHDSIDMLNVQLYNSGSMYGIDGNVYSSGTADFIVSQTEAVIQGFSTSGGHFNGFSPEHVGVGLPACSSAGGGYISYLSVAKAMKYLLGYGPQPGNYTLLQTGGYPNLRGMMTWSINWDATSSCGSVYGFANNYEDIFNPITLVVSAGNSDSNIRLFPNPSSDLIHIKFEETPLEAMSYIISNLAGQVFLQGIASGDTEIKIQNLADGIYFLRMGNKVVKWVKMN